MINTRNLIDRLFYTNFGQIMISALFGISLALIFNRVCKENCTIYFAPKQDEINNKIFKLEETCYKYSTINVPCNDKALETYSGNIKPYNQMDEKGFIDKLFA
jgi:hypothetical protein